MDLGFEAVTKTHLQTGVVTFEQKRQDTPFVGPGSTGARFETRVATS